MNNSIELVKTFKNKNYYKSANWNIEYAIRHIIRLDNQIIEISYFNHYYNDRFIKSALELPVSFGCPISCRYCASGQIKKNKNLTAEQILSLYTFSLKENNLAANQNLLITFTGIGEGALNFQNIYDATLKIQKDNPKARFTFSTVGIKYEYFQLVDGLSSMINSHYLQITYIHNIKGKIYKLIPNLKRYKFSMESVVAAISLLKNIKPRINIVLFKDFNDSIDDWKGFDNLFNKLKQKIRIRITSLNQTEASCSNNLEPVNADTLDLLNNFLIEKDYDSYVYHTDINDNLNCGQLIWNYDND